MAPVGTPAARRRLTARGPPSKSNVTADQFNAINWVASTPPVRNIPDGAANTAMVTEVSMDPTNYRSNGSWFTGWDSYNTVRQVGGGNPNCAADRWWVAARISARPIQAA